MNSNLLAMSKPGPAMPESPRLNSRRNMVFKRAFDIFASLALIALLLPLFVIVACAIMVQDGRPILFGHRRIGRNGKPFQCWKFRTMVRDADDQLAMLLASDPAARREWQETQKLKNDPRIIPGIGHFLRRSSLDELPQFFNVLTGDMSMVGPRPVVLAELDRYGSYRVHYTSVRPGLTGPWQVSERSDGDYDERIRKDVLYVENWTFADDVKIIARTARVPFESRGAY